MQDNSIQTKIHLQFLYNNVNISPREHSKRIHKTYRKIKRIVGGKMSRSVKRFEKSGRETLTGRREGAGIDKKSRGIRTVEISVE